MKQLIQNYRSGRLTLAEVPIPKYKPGNVLVRTINSLISVGTEKSIVLLGQQGLIGKARSRPAQFRRAIEKAKSEGIFKVWKEAMIRLDNPKSLGYSAAGIVTEVGYGVNNLQKGDRVACIGAGYASHAEVNCLPDHMCVKIPEGVSFEEASFGMLGIIALQGVRCADICPGQKVAVLGLGLLGQITVQLLKAYGCSVIGADIQPEKLQMAASLGCDRTVLVEDVSRSVADFTDGAGVDKIIITAATRDNALIILSAEIARFRAKIVLVGVVDINIPRQAFWEKELEFQISKAGGYDPLLAKAYAYDDDYVSRSQQRNLEEFLSLVAEGKVRVEPLITHRFNIDDSLQSYKMITAKNSKESYLGVVLNYHGRDQDNTKVTVSTKGKERLLSAVPVGFIGAGVFSKVAILPLLKRHRSIHLKGVATTKGNTSWHTAHKFGFDYCSTDYHDLLADDSIASVFIMTRHDTHARLVQESLQAGKHVFVEKPLATRLEDLRELYRTLRNSQQHLLVGFNRRFSQLARQVRRQIADVHFPLVINIQVNAGNAPQDHWVFDEKEGGKRIIGEVCHFIDLAQFLTGSVPVSVFTQNIATANKAVDLYDNTISVIRFQDQSICNILYTSMGDRSYPREKIVVFDNGAVYEIDNFRRLRMFTPSGKRVRRLWSQDMGYRNEMDFWIKNLQGMHCDTTKLQEGYFWTTLTTLKMMESLQTHSYKSIDIKELSDTL